MLYWSKLLTAIVPHIPIKAASSAILQCLADEIFPASSSLTFPENDMFPLFSSDRYFRFVTGSLSISRCSRRTPYSLFLQRLVERIGQRHRAVPAARASDGDDQLVLPSRI